MKKAQIAMEYLFVVGFAFLMVVPLIMVFYSESANLEDEVISAQARKVVDEMVAAADSVYYLGPPSHQTLKLNFPDKITQVSIQETGIIFLIDSSNGGPYELTGFAETNLSGSLESYDGIHIVTIRAMGNNVTISEE